MAKPRFIFRMVDFYDADGRHLRERKTVSGKPPAEFSRFIGFGTLHVRGPRSPVAPDGIYKEPYWFPLETASSLAEAFDQFDEAAKVEAARVKEEIIEMHRKAVLSEASEIVVPTQAQQHGLKIVTP